MVQGEGAAMNCPHCQSPIRIETAQFTEFTCGAGFEHAPEGIQHWECAEGKRQSVEDLDVDDEINRRREHRHFEPDHFGR